jgi:hypothetical protein
LKISLLDPPEGDVIARAAYLGGPEVEFVVATNGQIDFRVVGDSDVVWAGSDADSFRRIVLAWNRFRDEHRPEMSEGAQRDYFDRHRREFEQLGALPTGLPPNRKPLWSLLLFEAENGLG